MARRKSAYELEELAKIARAKEAARKQAKQDNPKPYNARNPVDFETVYYRDPLEAGRFLQFEVKKQALTNLGGIADAGLLATIPDGSVVVEVNRGSKIAVVKLRWYYGDGTAIVVPATAEHGRWIKKYDARNGQSHWSTPFSIATGTFTLNTIIDRFKTYFNNTNGTKRESVLGVNGYAELVVGYGKQYSILDTSK
ncbi:hypothetical protein [Nostoc sp. TCL26-01]|uniref:hypothetical protein n=1 Tax=Nostoc sp. TCL26-01 TaxID=2576904 RepID=UPI0015BE6692|nr:hypothetical protein [Nostoc sp. TCL26-01]QLE58760.1 hypothetical protein FD725_26605 [Nostoc sp. TCL26-01]